MMNTSQIVDNCRYLEDKIYTQQHVMNIQEEKIKKLENGSSADTIVSCGTVSIREFLTYLYLYYMLYIICNM